MIPTVKTSLVLGLLLLSSITFPGSQSRSLDPQGASSTNLEETKDLGAVQEGEGEDYISDYTGVDEDQLGIGDSGRVILSDIFGSGLRDDVFKSEETVEKDKGIESRSDKHVEESSGRSLPAPDVDGTIREVQRLLDENPDLPRLSRSQILEIYHNLTRLERIKLEQSDISDETTTTTKAPAPTTTEKPKSLLVVLPFNAKDMRESSIEDLFTKRPVTQIISDKLPQASRITMANRDPGQFAYESTRVSPQPVYKPPTSTTQMWEQKVTKPKTNHYNHVLGAADRTRPQHTTTSARPVTLRGETKYHHSNVHTSSISSEDNIIVGSREPSHNTQRPSLVHYEWNKKRKQPQPARTTSTMRPVVVQYQEVEPFRPMPPKQNIDLNALETSQSLNQLTSNGFRPVTNTKVRKTTTRAPAFDFKPAYTRPEHGEIEFVKDASPTFDKTEITNTVTTTSSPWMFMTPLAPIEAFKLVYPTPNSKRVTTEKPEIRNDIQTVLASLGLFPALRDPQVVLQTTTEPTTTTVKPVKADTLTPEMREVLVSLGLLPPAGGGLSIAASNIQPVVYTAPITTTTTTTKAPEVYVPRPLSTNVDASSYFSFKPLPSGDTSSTAEVNTELKKILANFGLVPGENSGQDGLDFDNLSQIDIGTNREQKAIALEEMKNKLKIEISKQKTTGKMPDINMDVLSDDMKSVLENLGLVTTTSTERNEGHIFNPVFHAAALNTTETQLDKLNQLISTIQLLAKDNVTFNTDEIEELNKAFNLKEETETEKDKEDCEKDPNKSEIKMAVTNVTSSISLDQILDAPDPLTSEDLINLYIKNEIKRQEPKNSTEASTTESGSTTAEDASTTAVDVSSTTAGVEAEDEETAGITTTESTVERVLSSTTEPSDSFAAGDGAGEDDGGASLSDLADSFGGAGTEDEATADQELPPKKPNGLYFLLDWNSFLEVGEEGKNKTTIRFSPKVGNSRNFISVTVP